MVSVPIKKGVDEKTFENLVKEILQKKKEDAQADTSAEEGEIDRLVYGLYGLTDEDIEVVEGR